jgi:acetyl esterase/lipase
MTPHAHAFAERGYVSATITYRLAGDRLSQVGYQAAARAAQHDAQAAVRWFRRRAERLNIDPRRIFIAGHSAGAFTAARGGSQPGGSRPQRQPRLLVAGARSDQHLRRAH